jgi:hypothetical protein
MAEADPRERQPVGPRGPRSAVAQGSAIKAGRECLLLGTRQTCRSRREIKASVRPRPVGPKSNYSLPLLQR